MYYVEASANFNKPKQTIEDAIKKPGCLEAVSYTHLTLPTIELV